jgi:hypothetical protein
MIPAVTAALANLGLLERGRRPQFHIGLTLGESFWVHAFVDDRRFLHVKASRLISLETEARIYGEAWRTFRDFMPRPLAYCVQDGWEIFVSEGVEHRPLVGSRLLRDGGSGRTAAAFSRFFQVSQSCPPGESSSHANLLRELEAHFKDSQFAPVVARWCSTRGERELEQIGSVLQHSDFVANNIAVARSGLVVFDWEDYGKNRLPGLDLCTLMASTLDVDEADALLRLDGPVLRSACAVLGMDVSQFRRLVPLYLLSFLHLKGHYATEVRRRIASMLHRISITSMAAQG